MISTPPRRPARLRSSSAAGVDGEARVPRRRPQPVEPAVLSMLDELSIEGVGPPPATISAWEESARSSRSATPVDAAPEVPPTPEEALELERAKCAALEVELAASRARDDGWTAAASSLVNMLLLSPTQNAGYGAAVEAGLAAALKRLSFVAGLRYCDASFPSSDASKPRISLRRWASVEESEWDVDWTPNWTAEACVDGQRGISFSTLLRVTGLAVKGRLSLSFAADFSAVKIMFLEAPEVRLDVACHVTLGQMPLPFQAELGRLVRDEAAKLIATRMVSPNALSTTLRSKKELSDADFAAAEKAAHIGAERARLARTGSWGPAPSPAGKRR